MLAKRKNRSLPATHGIIKKVWNIAKNLTQEQLGEKIGVQKSQISRLERGKSITLSSLIRLFSAMEIPLTLDMKGVGKISLC